MPSKKTPSKKKRTVLLTKHVSIDAIIGGNLKIQRKLANLSREQMGDKLGITQQQIQKYEIGKNRIACSTLYTISQILEVPLLSFFAGLEEAESSATTLSKDDIKIISTYRSLTPAMQKNARLLLKSLSRD